MIDISREDDDLHRSGIASKNIEPLARLERVNVSGEPRFRLERRTAQPSMTPSPPHWGERELRPPSRFFHTLLPGGGSVVGMAPP